MKEKKIGVSKIVIQMGDKEATLTVEQAKELQAALNAVLGEKVIEKIIERDQWHYVRPYPYIYYGATVTVGDQPNTYGTTISYGNATGNYTINLGDAGDLLPA